MVMVVTYFIGAEKEFGQEGRCPTIGIDGGKFSVGQDPAIQ